MQAIKCQYALCPCDEDKIKSGENFISGYVFIEKAITVSEVLELLTEHGYVYYRIITFDNQAVIIRATDITKLRLNTTDIAYY